MKRKSHFPQITFIGRDWQVAEEMLSGFSTGGKRQGPGDPAQGR